MKARTMRCATAGKSMAFHNPLKTTTFTFSRNIDYITNGDYFRKGNLLPDLISIRIRNFKFFYVVKAFAARTLAMASFRPIHTIFSFFEETNLNCIIPFLLYSFLLENCTWASFNDGHRNRPAIFIINPSHS